MINDLCIDYLCVHVCKIAVCFICMHDKKNGIVLVFLIDRKSILNKMQFIVSCIYMSCCKTNGKDKCYSKINVQHDKNYSSFEKLVKMCPIIIRFLVIRKTH